MNKYMIFNDQNNVLHILVRVVRSLLKHTDLNITEFLSKILLFPEDCASSGLSQDPSNKKNNVLNMEIISWEYTSICAIQN